MEVKQVTYEGKPCPGCGGTVRYIKGNHCKFCKIMGYPFKKEKQTQALFKREKPCIKCGGHSFYKKSTHCVACHREANKRIYYRQRGLALPTQE